MRYPPRTRANHPYHREPAAEPVEVLRRLRPGECVQLPDGERAVVVRQTRDVVEVVQPQHMLGRGSVDVPPIPGGARLMSRARPGRPPGKCPIEHQGYRDVARSGRARPSSESS